MNIEVKVDTKGLEQKVQKGRVIALMATEDNNNGGVDLAAYHAFLGRLVKDGYIKMEELS